MERPGSCTLRNRRSKASSQATTRLVSIPNKVDEGYDEAFFYTDRRRRDGIADPLPLMPIGSRLPLLRKDGREECRGKWRSNRCSSFFSNAKFHLECPELTGCPCSSLEPCCESSGQARDALKTGDFHDGHRFRARGLAAIPVRPLSPNATSGYRNWISLSSLLRQPSIKFT